MLRRIFHIDLDSFYASVEMLDFPELRHVPVAVAYDGPRSVLCTSNYQARKFGVKAAMPLSIAKRQCPGLVIVPPRFARYKEMSEKVMTIVRQYTPLVETLSLDEAYGDITDLHHYRPFQSGTELCQDLQKRVCEETQLTCSLGLSPLKFVSKIASDWKKPQGLTVIAPRDLASFLQPLPLAKISGIGAKSLDILQRQHFFLLGDFLKLKEEAEAYHLFGKMGEMLYRYARGQDEREVTPYSPPVSVSAETTLEVDWECADPHQFLAQEEFQKLLGHLAHQFLKRAREQYKSFIHHDPEGHLRLKSLGIKMKNARFQNKQMQRLIPRQTLNHLTAPDIIKHCLPLFLELLERSPQDRWRLFGITGSWQQDNSEQLTFEGIFS
jgi:DNA polymerase IV